MDNQSRQNVPPWQMGEISPELLQQIMAAQQGEIPKLSSPTEWKRKPDLDKINMYLLLEKILNMGIPQAQAAPWSGGY